VTPEEHGAQSGIAIGPGLPGRPRWIWEAVAGPVNRLKVSFQVSVPPPSLCRDNVLVKRPVAPRLTADGFGVSWPTLSVAFSVVLVG
jgi:hypothetical protein